MKDFLLVALGGSVGACTRHAVGVWLDGRGQFPFATLCVNLVGCLLMGILGGAGWLTPDQPRRLLLAVGFLGSLTTFSAFGWETWKLMGEQRWVLVAANIGLNLLGGLVLVAAGVWLGKFGLATTTGT